MFRVSLALSSTGTQSFDSITAAVLGLGRGRAADVARGEGNPKVYL